jgi:hypothetical protein
MSSGSALRKVDRSPLRAIISDDGADSAHFAIVLENQIYAGIFLLTKKALLYKQNILLESFK